MALEKAIEALKSIETSTPCQECMYFTRVTEDFENHVATCDYWGDAIPEEHLEKGCENWDDLPF